MYVEKLTIHNFRCFADAMLDLNYPTKHGTDQQPLQNANVNLFLGDNGSGKSSIFKALALGVMSPIIQSSGFQAEYLVRRLQRQSGNGLPITSELQRSREETATVAATLQLSTTDASVKPDVGNSVIGRATIRRIADIETVVNDPSANTDIWEYMFFNESPAFFMVGYGANRRSERPEGYSEQKRSPRYQRIAGLFEDHVGLVPFSYANLELKNLGYFDEAMALLNALIPVHTQVFLTAEEDKQKRAMFDRTGVLLPFDALSDGFRTFIGWTWDLILQLARVQQGVSLTTGTNVDTHGVFVSKTPRAKLTDVTGVVIVDEIDLLLHPEWQRIVVDLVARAFPNLQFLFSTHSPLVAGTLRAENIFVMEEQPDGTVSVAKYRERIYGLTANQVLTSSYFGLRSTRAPGTGTLSDLVSGSGGGHENDKRGESPLSETNTALEQAEPNDRILTERAQRMLEEIDEE